jgi:fibro-slime domain-containing protein
MGRGVLLLCSVLAATGGLLGLECSGETGSQLSTGGASSGGQGPGANGGWTVGANGGAAGTGGMQPGVCGDGKINLGETCDDQNTASGDGCSSECQVEPGYKCPVVGALCMAALCGDSIVAGDEQCDDGNANPGDGCSDICQLEPGYKCPTPGQPCVPTVCGDGVAEGTEQCDDGNDDLGDGCTPFCTREPDCSQGACTSACGDGILLPNSSEECDDGNTQDGDGCSSTCHVEPGFVCDNVAQSSDHLDLPIVIRDFTPSHPDFEHECCGSDHGITTGLLGADNKPVYANPQGTTPMTSGQANFDQWYRDTSGVNLTILQTLTLGQLPTGEYQFASGAFFPIDGQGFGDYANSGHNFHFTSEVRYWFEYQGGEQLDFTGDDDVWVYVNKQKCVDLGGVHGAQSGSVLLDAAAAATYNLQVGAIYEIVVWQAERHTTESNYRLTLGNFNNAKSQCHSVCGDGIRTPNEACDDGVNDGSYGHCTADCQWGPYCGDGVVQEPYEQCDDGNSVNGDGCDVTCRFDIPT